MLTSPFTEQYHVFMTLRQAGFENIVEKVENAGNQHFLLFAQCFLAYQITNPICRVSFHMDFWNMGLFRKWVNTKKNILPAEMINFCMKN